MNRFGLVAAAALWVGCAGTGGLREKFQGQRSTLGYVQDSRQKPTSAVSIAEYRVLPELPEITGVERSSSFILPLLVFNSWSHDFDIKLGKEGVDPSLEAFGSRSLARDLERAGAAGNGGAGDLKVRVRVTELQSGATYGKTGFFYFFLIVYGFGFSHGAREIQSSIAADIVLERGGRADTLKFAHRENATVPPDRSGRAQPERTLNAMVETLSLCFHRMHSRILEEAAKTGG